MKAKYEAICKFNLLEKGLEASKTHQVSAVGLHWHTQEQITDGADEFSIDFLAIFISDPCSRHDCKI